MLWDIFLLDTMEYSSKVNLEMSFSHKKNLLLSILLLISKSIFGGALYAPSVNISIIASVTGTRHSDSHNLFWYLIIDHIMLTFNSSLKTTLWIRNSFCYSLFWIDYVHNMSTMNEAFYIYLTPLNVTGMFSQSYSIDKRIAI